MNNPLNTKPVPPADDDCCGGGSCSPCVWDQYYADLTQWQQQTENREDTRQSPLFSQQSKENTYR
ncbi:oxidoreductase-like domain-containing protein [Thalassotalea sp. SU-HH00458]|uniref:oxidoreductase-like domain-containing protein n=1 Tax=Thalassotalea sp. SU-HH00458 TaxID=3127657 RepID=UPI00336531C9